MIIKYGHAYEPPLRRHSIDYFVERKEFDGEGWRGEPLEAHLELEEIHRWFLPSKPRAKQWEKFFGGVLFPKRLKILSSIVNGYKEIREIEETDNILLQHIDLMNKHFPIKERGGDEKGQYVYLLKCTKRETPLVLPEILQKDNRLTYKK